MHSRRQRIDERWSLVYANSWFMRTILIGFREGTHEPSRLIKQRGLCQWTPPVSARGIASLSMDNSCRKCSDLQSTSPRPPHHHHHLPWIHSPFLFTAIDLVANIALRETVAPRPASTGPLSNGTTLLAVGSAVAPPAFTVFALFVGFKIHQPLPHA